MGEGGGRGGEGVMGGVIGGEGRGGWKTDIDCTKAVCYCDTSCSDI